MKLMKEFIEDMNRRVKRFGIIDMKLALGSAMFLALILADNVDQHLVVCGVIVALCH